MMHDIGEISLRGSFHESRLVALNTYMRFLYLPLCVCVCVCMRVRVCLRPGAGTRLSGAQVAVRVRRNMAKQLWDLYDGAEQPIGSFLSFGFEHCKWEFCITSKVCTDQ